MKEKHKYYDPELKERKARENILHMLWEQDRQRQKYLKKLKLLIAVSVSVVRPFKPVEVVFHDMHSQVAQYFQNHKKHNEWCVSIAYDKHNCAKHNKTVHRYDPAQWKKNKIPDVMTLDVVLVIVKKRKEMTSEKKRNCFFQAVPYWRRKSEQTFQKTPIY